MKFAHKPIYSGQNIPALTGNNDLLIHSDLNISCIRPLPWCQSQVTTCNNHIIMNVYFEWVQMEFTLSFIFHTVSPDCGRCGFTPGSTDIYSLETCKT